MNEYETEGQLVGIALRDPSVIGQAAGVTPMHFEDERLGCLWGVLLSLHEAGQSSSDPAMILREAKLQGVWDQFGGAARLAVLARRAGLSSSVDLHIADILNRFERKRLRGLLQQTLDDLDDTTGDCSAIRSKLDASLHADASDLSDVESLDEIVASTIDRMSDPDEAPGVSTGIQSFDSATGGLHPGEMIVIAARPSVGKSALATGIGLHASTLGNRVLFISLEMSGRDIAARMLAAEAEVSFVDIRRRRANQDRLRLVSNAFAGLPFRIWSGRGMTIDRLRSICRLEQARGGVNLIIVDYIGLIEPADRRKPRWESVTEVSNALKSLALSMSVPVVVLCQLNREAEGEKPKLSHLRESGAIEQDADIVALLHRERDSSEATLSIAKIRNGRTGDIDLNFDGQRTTFTEREIDFAPVQPHSEFAGWSQ